MSQNKQTVQRYMDAFSASNHAEVLDCLTDDIEWILPGGFHLSGKIAFDKEIENDAFLGNPVISLIEQDYESEIVLDVRVTKCSRIKLFRHI